MTDESVLAPEAGPEVATNAPAEQPEQGQVEAQTAEQEAPEGVEGEDEKKSRAAARRERRKAQEERVRQELETARGKAEVLERELSKYEQRLNSEPPKQESYSTFEEFIAARSAWEVRKADAQDRAGEIRENVDATRGQEQALTQQQREMLDEHWYASVSEAQERYADYEAVVAQKGLFPRGTALPDLIKMSDAPADLAYAVAKDRKLHDALLRMHPVEAARELGRIEATLTNARARTVTTAPPPVTPIKGGSAAGKDPAKMTGAEYKQWRAAGGKIT